MNKLFTMSTVAVMLFSALNAFAQPTQTVRGKVYDSETNFPLVGAKVTVSTADTTKMYRGLTNIDGEFKILNVPTGKHQLEAQMMTYDPRSMTIEVISGKESVVNVPMSESFHEQAEVTVSARKKGEVINELALISAQQFSVEETNRYPGSRMDPARMASNFAGVQGADDSRNDIIIRGNSPLGVIWKVEGIDIPNPSHFAISGSTGGPVSILNNKILGNSDFFMSAFPAEYGNSTSGVFDLKLRNGNNNRHEFTGQFGFLGTEALAEGPMGKNSKNSYLIMGRYSSLKMFQAIGLQLGTDAVPGYYDAAFKFNFAFKNGGSLSFWGMGGKSAIDIKISDQTELTDELYGEGDRDQYFRTQMGVTGVTYKKALNEKTFVTATASLSYEQQISNHDYIYGRRLDSLTRKITYDSLGHIMTYNFQTTKASGFFSINHKINRFHLIKVGINADFYSFNLLDSVKSPVNSPNYTLRWDYQGTSVLIQPFVQWKWRINENMDFTAGLHSQYFSSSNSVSPVEPRVGWKYRMRNNQAIFAGGGMHSGTQPMYTYFYHQNDANGNKVYQNKNMDFSRSVHSGIGYEKMLKKSMSIRTEAYYQNLYNIPVTVDQSSFSLINMGGGFARFFPDSLQNTGTGENYGIELTVQKYFDKSFFFLFSGSVYNSKYRGSDGELRNTSYNGNYVFNVLAGKEFQVNPKNIIGIGMKVTYAGGRRYGVADDSLSMVFNEVIFKDDNFNEYQFRPYFRADVKISWRMNANKLTHEIGLDLVNIFNTENLLSIAYAPSLDPNTANDPNYSPFAERNQLGFLPIFYYKIDFKLDKKKE